MAARHTIWKWAGIADDWWGRIKVLAFVFGLATTGLLAIWLFFIRDLGVTGIVVLVLAALFGLLTLSLASEIWSPDEGRVAESLATVGAPKPRLNLGVEVRQAPVALFLDYERPEIGRFFWLHNVLITNRAQRKVSLMPKLAIELVTGATAVLEQKGIELVPKQFTAADRLLHGPLNVAPDDTVPGDIGFSMLRAEMRFHFGDDYDKAVNRERGESSAPVMYLVLEDRVSGQESAHEVTRPRMKPPPQPMSLRELQQWKTRKG